MKHIIIIILIVVLLYIMYQEYPKVKEYTDTNLIQPIQGAFNSMLSRANRNNNPGNLRYAGQVGATGKDAQGFAIFETPGAGWDALTRQIALDQSRGLSLGEFISKYAPASENDTQNYLNFVMSATGNLASDSLSSVNVSSLSQAIAKMEGYS